MRLGVLPVVLVLCLIAFARGVPPNVANYTYQLKSGQFLGVDLDLAQYEVQFDQDVGWLDLVPCEAPRNCVIPSPSSCPPCDYSGQGALCGTVPRNPSCSARCNYTYYCNNTGASWWAPWIQLVPGAPPQAPMSLSAGSWQYYRVYIPDNSTCNQVLRVMFLQFSGDIDIFVSDDPATVGANYYPWSSIGAGAEVTYLCPSSPFFSGPGTWFIGAVFGTPNCVATAKVEWESLTGSPPSLWPSKPAWCTNYPNHTCVQPGVELIVAGRPLPADQTLYFVSQLSSSPCPNNLWGMMATVNNPSPYLTGAFSFTNPYPVSASWQADSPARGDYPPITMSVSACDPDGLVPPPSVIFFSLTLPLASPGSLYDLRLFTSTDPANFRVRGPADLVAQYDSGAAYRFGQSIVCNGGAVVLGPCLLAAQPGCAIGYGVVAPLISDRSPLWPPLPIMEELFFSTISAPVYNQNASFDQRQLTFTVALRFSLASATDPLRSVAQDLRVMNDIDASTCLPDFAYCRALVNAAFEGVRGPVPLPALAPPTCDLTAYGSLKSFIDASVSSISNSSIPPSVVDALAIELDYVSFADSYTSCDSQLQDLLKSSTDTVLFSTRSCLNSPDLASDPCCQLGYVGTAFDWDQCCLVHNAPDLIRQSSQDISAVDRACGSDSQCISTFLGDYLTAESAGAQCLAVLPNPDRFHFLETLFWVSCSQSTYGLDLAGVQCNCDADCFNGSVCDGSVCRATPAVLLGAFLDCLLSADSHAMKLLLASRGVATASVGASKSQLLQLYKITDCLALTNVAIPPDDSAVGQAHYLWTQPGCAGFLCSPSPRALGPYIEAPPECAAFYHGYDCPGAGAFAWQYDPSSASSTCSAPACNWGVANCSSQPFVCAYCYDALDCVAFPSVSSSAECATLEACLVPNGTHVLVAKGSCASNYACDQPCWSGGASVPCDAASCAAGGGSCSDSEWLPFSSGGGLCLLPPQPQFFPACPVVLPGSVATPAGCLMPGVNSSGECRALPLGPQYNASLWPLWWPLATTRNECLSLCGCEKPPVDSHALRKSVIGPPSSAAACASCGQSCSSYWTWQPGRWLAGTPRPLSWVPTASGSRWALSANGFDFAAFSADLDAAVTTLHNYLLQTYEMCRFNLRTPAIDAVACACGSSPAGCLPSVDTSLPIGQGTVCAGVGSTLVAPPHMLSFSPSSVSAGCAVVTIRGVSQVAFESAVTPPRLSGYFSTQRTNDIAFSFENQNGAVVGYVVGSGISVTASINFTNATICFDQGAPYSPDPTFGVLDIALSGVVLLPLSISVTTSSEGFCGTLPALASGTYVPVARSADFATAAPPGLTTGGKAVLALCAAVYFAFALFTPYYCARILLNSGFESIQNATFWLPLVLCVANVLRGIYFSLTAAQTLSESTFVDVILIELPTMLRFTSATLMGLFWVAILVSSGLRKRGIAKKFWTLFAVANIAMYILFIAMVIVFSTLPESVTVECNGRLPNSVNTTPKKTAFIIYQAFIAAMGLLVALVYLIGGVGLAWTLHSFEKGMSVSKGSSAIQFRLFLVATVVAASFLAFSVFLLVIALTTPGIPYLALVLVALELIPEGVLYWNLPRPSQAAQVTGTTATGSGSPASGGVGTASSSSWSDRRGSAAVSASMSEGSAADGGASHF